MKSRRQSFVGGKSFTDSGALPRFDQNQEDKDPFATMPKLSNTAPNNYTKTTPLVAQLSDEELAAQAAFEAILEMKQRKLRAQQLAAGSPASPSSPTYVTQQQLQQQINNFSSSAGNLDADELHEFLGNFGLLSREALRDDLKVTSPTKDDLPSPQMSRSVRAPAAAAAQIQTSTVAEGDFVDFLLRGGDGQKRMDQLQKRRGSAAWIDMAVERHNNAIAKAQALQQQQQQQMMLNHQDSSGGFAEDKKQLVTTVVDLVSDDGDGSLRDEEGIHSSGHGGDSNNNRYDSQTSEETLAAIERKLRDALEARANSPVPSQLKTDHELMYEQRQKARLNNSTASGGGGGGGSSPNSPNRYGKSPSASRARSRQGNYSSNNISGSQHNHSPGSASSPSAMLRKHQQAQLEALLQVRRNGGSLLAARSSSNVNNTASAKKSGTTINNTKSRIGTSTMAGFTVVRK